MTKIMLVANQRIQSLKAKNLKVALVEPIANLNLDVGALESQGSQGQEHHAHGHA